MIDVETLEKISALVYTALVYNSVPMVTSGLVLWTRLLNSVTQVIMT